MNNIAVASSINPIESSTINSNKTLWIQLTPAGQFSPTDGRQIDVPYWFIDKNSAEQVINRFNLTKTQVVLDYEHQTVFKEQNGQPAPAAGWFKQLEWREGSGLWGLAELTDRAIELISKGEYRYFSPVIAYDNTGVVQAFVMGALTNRPALDNLEPLQLAAASFNPFHTPNRLNTLLSDEEKRVAHMTGLTGSEFLQAKQREENTNQTTQQLADAQASTSLTDEELAEAKKLGLTPEEAMIAKMTGLSFTEYAEAKKATANLNDN